jgi:hypothetical protein
MLTAKRPHTMDKWRKNALTIHPLALRLLNGPRPRHNVVPPQLRHELSVFYVRPDLNDIFGLVQLRWGCFLHMRPDG